MPTRPTRLEERDISWGPLWLEAAGSDPAAARTAQRARGGGLETELRVSAEVHAIQHN